MKPATKEELRKLVTATTIDVYEDLAPQAMQMLKETSNNKNLTAEQLQAEQLLNIMAYIKSCTNDIIVEVLAEVLEL
ncbi:hypothetical protein [Anaerolentibacter hominis]|uniref:hypothetical protein n=1 Tax=Anaerolentibacter hominis TaxID=3079009 RepID=UPI0031B8254B